MTSLILMTIFMIFSTILFFNRRNLIANTHIFNGEYTDMAFEVIDNHIFVGSTDLSDIGYNKIETYSINLNLKYKEQYLTNLKVNLNFDDINIKEYDDCLFYLTITDKDNNIVRERSKLNIINEKILLLDKPIVYSDTNYKFNFKIEIYSDENYNASLYELANRLSAELL